MARAAPEELARQIVESPMAAIVPPKVDFVNWAPPEPKSEGSKLPMVFAHGMGDSCFNPGMKQITNLASKRAGVYGVCIGTGNNIVTDVLNGFLMTMNKNVEVFAQKVRSDPKLKNGFNAVGFSQGNSIIRGYIQKYNDPPVNIVIHVHGTVSGVAGFPQCNPSNNIICKSLAALCGNLAYNPLVQGVLFQADYFRDPHKLNSDGYKKYSEIAKWNNEAASNNATYSSNFNKTNRFVMVKALADTMVFPNEGEWWGHFADGSDKEVLPMNQTVWYKNNLFGLRDADKAGKIFFETTPGNHLKFTVEDLYEWIDKYIIGM
eukprot:CAMPEP_0197523132 /NCGR_PEP_ID=MMETSP1318-20131121/8127_1 /TAXON_ID=552666 /ORGANISM="Partenskyella glossopodia, Strain RCC365" /LENGTH=318 /DNA_ID=CAMNT_0043075723 /DNA_START=214 /DNA_END=1170 /DNA_ORIENTATION=+